MEFSILGFFWVEKFGKYFFGWLDLSRVFGGIADLGKVLLNQMKERLFR